MINPNTCPCCGGDFEYRSGRWKCRACGSYKPEELSGEETSLVYAASQKLRLAEFYEAEQEFDDIIRKYPENPLAYWGRLMAKYGIKYEEDYDGSKIPTCYAASIESILDSKDYEMALKYADEENRAYYKKQAEYIERVRKEWVAKAKKEKPYDVFICYKDSDLANGIEHTQDSDDMQELCLYLMDKGYRVFFSRVSLSNKGGEKYEPYIFNALSTAKVMLVYGSRPEYITSTWMKNEWTRYAGRIRAGEKHPASLLVAYKGFSPNELPAPLRARQCFDAGKQRFYSDLVDAIERIIRENAKKNHKPEKTESPSAEEPIPTLHPQEPAHARSKGLEYTLERDGKSCVIKSLGTCKDADVVIPSTIDGYTVTGIGKHAFDHCLTLKSVTVPESVVFIGDHAFAGCAHLTAVTLSDSVTRIGISAFSDCKKLGSLEIPAGITEIGYGVFRGCSCLDRISIPAGVTGIGIAAFADCRGLSSFTVPQSVTAIGSLAFENCVRLTELRYTGTKRFWKKINLHETWRNGSALTLVTCSRGKIKLKNPK